MLYQLCHSLQFSLVRSAGQLSAVQCVHIARFTVVFVV